MDLKVEKLERGKVLVVHYPNTHFLSPFPHPLTNSITYQPTMQVDMQRSGRKGLSAADYKRVEQQLADRLAEGGGAEGMKVEVSPVVVAVDHVQRR